MPLIYITGTPGAGKTAVRDELQRRGYTAYDTDEDGLAHYYNTETNELVYKHMSAEARTEEWRKTHAWKVPRSAVEKLHAEAANKPVFLSGVVANDFDELWDVFDNVIALTIDETTLCHRITTRTTGDYGKNEHEFAGLLAWQKTAMDKYRKRGAVIIDATQPLSDVVDKILESNNL
jgi:broad-specificity NMP kinase